MSEPHIRCSSRSAQRRSRFCRRVAVHDPRNAHHDIHRAALVAARQAVLAVRAEAEIGDDAFHQIEEELDWLEMAVPRKGE